MERFVKSVEYIITAMDISICFADFPTDKIAETTRAYRQLGIGYANLGALLMASGLPYDSDAGRSVAASITSLMTGVAYRRSAELAAVVGAYEGYARNADAHKRVMRKHAAANDEIKPYALGTPLVREATRQWQSVLKLGEKNGFRNAQASLLAPTGTIGLMMDCDTTGIEPDLALVKFKKLVGGGSMQIVNQTVPEALRNLGYQQEQVEAIVEFIAEHGHVVNAPGLKPEHYPVFDCAMGERSIAPMGHVRMMAATQPFLSGAISKTINMPESATVEDVEHVHMQGWKLGLKALAIYRDNCKVGQPLSNARGKKEVEKPAEVQKVVEYRPMRTRLPKKRPSETVSFTVGGAKGYLTASSYPEGGLGEVFLKMSKQGSTLAGVMDAFSVAISIGLQYGVPLETYVGKFTNMRFEPAGMTDDPDIRMARLGDGLHLPPAGAGLPALRDPGRPRHLHRGGADRPGPGRGGRRGRGHGRARRAAPRSRPSRRRRRAEETAARSRHLPRPARRWSCWSGSRARSPTRRCASPAARRCARPAAATSARAAAPPAAAAEVVTTAAPGTDSPVRPSAR